MQPIIFTGLVDLQVNGYGDVDFSSENLSLVQINQACRSLASRGTERFLATLVTSPLELYERNLALLRQAIEQDPLAQSMIAGLHLEGPFISPERGVRGAHNPRFVQKPDLKFFKKLLRAGGPALRMRW